jgi:hypothetical protein
MLKGLKLLNVLTEGFELLDIKRIIRLEESLAGSGRFRFIRLSLSIEICIRLIHRHNVSTCPAYMVIN